MSIAESPLLGPMRKSMGNFTVYTLNGMNIVRSKAFKHNDAKTEKQLIMRTRMTLFGKMYRTFNSIICLGFPERDERKSPQNMFVSVNFTTAFVMVDTTPVISYPLMMLSKGSLPKVQVLDAGIDGDGITIRYGADLSFKGLHANDEMVACALLKSGPLLITRQIRGHHNPGTIQLKYPDLQAEEVTCCYVFSRSGDGKKASDTVFVGVNG